MFRFAPPVPSRRRDCRTSARTCPGTRRPQIERKGAASPSAPPHHSRRESLRAESARATRAAKDASLLKAVIPNGFGVEGHSGALALSSVTTGDCPERRSTLTSPACYSAEPVRWGLAAQEVLPRLAAGLPPLRSVWAAGKGECTGVHYLPRPTVDNRWNGWSGACR
jgi:hypothetical protein